MLAKINSAIPEIAHNKHLGEKDKNHFRVKTKLINMERRNGIRNEQKVKKKKEEEIAIVQS
jgi:hypothetical protein